MTGHRPVSASHLLALGIVLLLTGAAAILVIFCNTFEYLRTKYSWIEVVTYVLAISVVLTVPIAAAVYGISWRLRITRWLCAAYCASAAFGEHLHHAQKLPLEGWTLTALQTVTPDHDAASMGATILHATLIFILLEMMGHVAGFGVELIEEARCRRTHHKRRSRSKT